MKSLAHPGWPYTGTPHEWRGFATCRPLTKEEDGLILEALRQSTKHQYDIKPAVYQKQNFGPELT